MTIPTPPQKPWSQHRRPGRRTFPKQARRIILNRHTTCALALPGCTLTPTEADHIIGWRQAMALGWTQKQYDAPTNGRGVCSSCHNKVTQQQAAAGRRAEAQARQQRQRPTQQHPGLI